MNKIPDMLQPSGTSEAFLLKYSDGSSRQVYVTGQELALGGKVIFSTTDLHGNIVKVNNAFIQASGWTEAELIGRPHHILRHPHMPKAAFEEMWHSLKTTNHWQGYVKNLRKDGGHYWVLARVHAVKENGEVIGYQSVRHKIPDAVKQKCEKEYAQMRAAE